MNDAYKKSALAYLEDVVSRSGKTPSELARIVGLSTTMLTRPLNNPEHPHAISGRTLQKLAEYMREDLPLSLRPNPATKTAPIISTVGAGAIISPETEPFDRVYVTMDCPPETFAVIVRGDSQSPKFEDGDVLICAPVTDVREVLRHFAVIDLDDGRRYLKRVMPGRTRNLFTLLSVNATAIEDARIIRAARILYTKHS